MIAGIEVPETMHVARDMDGLPVVPELGCWIPCTDDEFDDIYLAHGGTDGDLGFAMWDETLRVLGLTWGPFGEPLDLPLLAVVAAMLCEHDGSVAACLEPATGYRNGLFHCAQRSGSPASPGGAS